MALIRILTLIASALALLGARPARADAWGADRQAPETIAQAAAGCAAKAVAPATAVAAPLAWGDLPVAILPLPAPPLLHPSVAAAPTRRLPPKPYAAHLTSGSSPPRAPLFG
jgi:hypothetical protein